MDGIKRINVLLVDSRVTSGQGLPGRESEGKRALYVPSRLDAFMWLIMYEVCVCVSVKGPVCMSVDHCRRLVIMRKCVRLSVCLSL